MEPISRKRTPILKIKEENLYYPLDFWLLFMLDCTFGFNNMEQPEAANTLGL
jgi:hypothetical protein